MKLSKILVGILSIRSSRSLTWDSPSVTVRNAEFNKWSPLAGLIPNDDDGTDLTLRMFGPRLFNIGYTTENPNCSGNVVTIAKGDENPTALPSTALDKPLCYKSTNVFPKTQFFPITLDNVPPEIGKVTLTKKNPLTSVVTSVDADFSVANYLSVLDGFDRDHLSRRCAAKEVDLQLDRLSYRAECDG
jgi:hypothetical protein